MLWGRGGAASEECLEVRFMPLGMYGALSHLSYLWDLGFGGAKRWGEALKPPFGMAMQATSSGGDNFNGEGGGGAH